MLTSLSSSLPVPVASVAVGARYQLVSLLLHRSAALLHVAVRLQPRTAAPATEPAAEPVAAPSGTLEYHAEAGAPEGALYLDGQLVGWLSGVQRL
jgi:hypothetical protein